MTAGARVVGDLFHRKLRARIGFTVCVLLALTGTNLVTSARAATVGAGFTVTSSDLTYILKQITIAERHARAYLGTDPTIPANPRPAADPWYCQAMVGAAPDQIPNRLTTFGLRTVDGSCNNLFAGRESYAAADQPFPRLVPAAFQDAEASPPGFPAASATSYAQKAQGNVVYDSEPRLVSNLIVDQTVTNPAAVDAALHPVRSQDPSPSAIPCDANGQPTGCTPRGKTLFIPNITTDVGLSPPYNSWFTFFGQFFDHGVDQTVKGSGTVIVPLAADDPLRTVGPDGDPSTNDAVPASQAFMVLTRAQHQPGPDGVLGTTDDVQDATNTDSPWVDQSQTYASHASHQAFLREYAQVGGRPLPTGRLLTGLGANLTWTGSPDMRGGVSTWAAVKKQARDLFGIRLTDRDALDVPMLRTDPYGNLVLGPNGRPQLLRSNGSLVEGVLDDPATPADETVPVPSDAAHFDTPFLTDIAHNADPGKRDLDHDGVAETWPTPDADSTPSTPGASQPTGSYDDELLAAHFACGDGRCNENIALSAVHQVFHSEHDRLVEEFDTATLPADPTLKAAYEATNCPVGCATNDATKPITFSYGQRLFQAARFVTEMEYQHLVFEEFARKVQPAVRPFRVYSPDLVPAVSAEFAHAVYRFGHSMLDEDVARFDERADGSRVDNSLPLLTAFLNPPAYFAKSGGATYTPQAAAGALVMGSVDQTGNEIDEFVTEALRNNLLGLPLDLATLNLARARDAGVPPLNQVRRALHAQTQDSQVMPYESWADFGQHLKHPASLVNFVAAYGTHPSVTSQSTIAGRRSAAREIVDPQPGDTPPADAQAFLFGAAYPGVDAGPGIDGDPGTGCDTATPSPACADNTPAVPAKDWSNRADGLTRTGVDDVDLWVGGLAEQTNLNGGLLGSTNNYVFQQQLEVLQDGDRFYYLARTPGMNLRTQLEGNSFAEMIMRNTTGTHTLKADVFSTADCKFELKNLAGTVAGWNASGATVTDDPISECDESKVLVRSPDGTLAYKQNNNGVDPAGINGQAVYNGTTGVDRVKGGVDNDTVWGDDGDDVIDAQAGDDVVLGGEGNDRITDLGGLDVLKGGPGDDAIDLGPGDDIAMGGDGADVLLGGANDNVTFSGEGNDFVVAGQGADVVFGDGGDDWIQGGSGQDLLQGDHGAPFFDDPGQRAPGNDVFVGQVGENDYDSEGGDDLMAQNAAVDRNVGSGGFDWAFHQYDTVGADDDLEINKNLGTLALPVVVNRDRWSEVEADSGSRFNDTIRGTTAAPKNIAGAGFTGCNALDPAGVARIAGLDRLVTSFPTDVAPIVAASAAGYCPLNGAVNTDGTGGLAGNGKGNVWAEGDVLLGGAGSDLIEGRNDDDVIDGDHALRVRISVRTLGTDGKPTATELGWTDLLEGTNKNPATVGFGPGTTAASTLQQAVFAGTVKPAQLVVVREIVDPAGAAPGATANRAAAGDCAAGTAASNCDVAMFSLPAVNYSITRRTDGAVVVTQLGTVGGGGGGGGGLGNIADGTDVLWNVELLRFCTSTDAVTRQCTAWVDQPVPAPVQAPTQAPTVTGVTAGPGSVTVTFVPGNGAPFSGFEADALAGSTVVGTGSTQGTSGTLTITGLTNGVPVRVVVRSVNAGGASPNSAPSAQVTPVDVPTAPVIGTAAATGSTTATVSWTAPTSTGGTPLTGYQVEALVAGIPQFVVPVPTTPTSTTVTGLTPGTTYTFWVRAINAAGESAPSAESNAVTTAQPATPPGAPVIGSATRGNASATVTWTAPAISGAGPITGYEVQVRRAGRTTVVGALRPAPAGATSLVVTGLTNGTAYDFRVRARNVLGAGAYSARSNAVTPVTVPGAPDGVVAVSGTAGGAVTATALWSSPASNGGSAITGYRVIALRMSSTSSTATVLETVTSPLRPAGARSYAMPLPVGGTYRFHVVAVNAIGDSARSTRSNAVTGR